MDRKKCNGEKLGDWTLRECERPQVETFPVATEYSLLLTINLNTKHDKISRRFCKLVVHIYCIGLTFFDQGPPIKQCVISTRTSGMSPRLPLSMRLTASTSYNWRWRRPTDVCEHLQLGRKTSKVYVVPEVVMQYSELFHRHNLSGKRLNDYSF